jgi:hypothetical protein
MINPAPCVGKNDFTPEGQSAISPRDGAPMLVSEAVRSAKGSEADVRRMSALVKGARCSAHIPTGFTIPAFD